MAYNQSLRELGKMAQISYLSPSNRAEIVFIKDGNINYIQEKSSDLYSHYEDERDIIVAFHGANSIELSLGAIRQFISQGAEDNNISMVCSKFQELMNEEKPVTLVGHSLGAFMIASCSIRFNHSFNSVFYAPYVPKQSGVIVNNMGSNPKFIKVFYESDIFALNLLSNPNLQSAIVLQNNGFIFSLVNKKGHASKLFSQDLSGDIKEVK
jgi:hypothetical protein